MKNTNLFLSVLTIFLFSAQAVSAGANRGAVRRSAEATQRHNLSFSQLGKDYTEFKNYLSKKFGFNYAVDISYMPQRGTPSGHKTAFQTMIYPSFSWQMFNNEYGNGTLNFAYNIVRYGGKTAAEIESNIGVVMPINDYDSKSNSFNELYYFYQFPEKYNWLSLAFGQFPLYNFDGTNYDSNQQVNFINYALSQNATSTYPTSGLGAYAQISPNTELTVAFGAQNAENITATSLKPDRLNKKHFTGFFYTAYSPIIKNIGQSEFSVLLYNQPAVKAQPQTTNGWSLNVSQNMGEKLSLFGRINGVSGNVADAKMSWVAGGVYNNPFDRNPLDQIGLAFTYNKINAKAVGSALTHKNEKIIESYWAIGLSKWATLTPDIQFYINPAQNKKSDYGAAFSLRASVFF